MCRLLAIKSKSKKILKDSLISFRSLDQNGKLPTGIEGGHKDGFGIVFYNNGKIIGEYKDCTASSQSVTFANAINFLNNNNVDLCIAHIRKATVGSLNINNIHPFTESNISFAHNGTVSSIKEDIDEELIRRIKGETDSEFLFYNLLDSNDYKVNIINIQDFANNVKNKYFKSADGDKNTSFCNLLTDGNAIFATRLYNENHSKRDIMNFESYYTLYLGANDEADIICSEILDVTPGTKWEPIQNGVALEV